MDLFEFVELYINASDETKLRFHEALTEYEAQEGSDSSFSLSSLR